MGIGEVVIVGGGFSGALLAVNLLRHDGPRAVLIERSGKAGDGLAFGAAHPDHLLNVRAGNMSAFPDQPHHFVGWMAEQGLNATVDSFVPRLLYGRYLRELLAKARASAPDRLQVVDGEVVDLVPGPPWQVMLADRSRRAADAVVLAIGNLPPHTPALLDRAGLDPDRYQADPWQPDAFAGLKAGDDILVLGTALTMVDIVLALDAHGFAGRIVALSRRGLLPHVHAHEPAVSPFTTLPPTRASHLLRAVRSEGRVHGWRAVIDSLRPVTQRLWQAASPDERARFLRHLRPWWDIHRHRVAPQVAERLQRLESQGRLQVAAGKLLGAVPAASGVDLQWRRRGCDAPADLHVRRIINCTGPQADIGKSRDPLMMALHARGQVRADALRLGIDVNAQMQVIDAAGAGSATLFAVGPLTRGAFWEIVAVPDIRRQTWTLARRFAHAHWIGGEGL